jgi:hypothetical protein
VSRAGYGNEPIALRLDDPESAPIVRQSIGGLPAQGRWRKIWRFGSKGNGIVKVRIKSLAHQGFLDNSSVLVGPRGFSQLATRKVD